MSEDFDALHRWLGIPPEEQPANHYRLLGLKAFESDLDVIEAAADQRMGYVRQKAAGKHSTKSQSILNLLSGARVCLLNSEEKQKYDIVLKTALTKAAGLAKPKPAAPLPQAASLPAKSNLPVGRAAAAPVPSYSPIPVQASPSGNERELVLPSARFSAGSMKRNKTAQPPLLFGATVVGGAAIVVVGVLLWAANQSASTTQPTAQERARLVRSCQCLPAPIRRLLFVRRRRQ